MMDNNMLAEFYERDIDKLINEINLFKHEENLWKTSGDVKNAAGNLALHIIGGTNYLIGTVLEKTGYVRHRDQEFITIGVPRRELTDQLEKLIVLVKETLKSLTQEQMDGDFPIFFDKPGTSVNYVLTQLLLHLNYHLGQVNYLRRILD